MQYKIRGRVAGMDEMRTAYKIFQSKNLKWREHFGEKPEGNIKVDLKK
jgi:hypothetical protein